jgi:hypothetical protein
MDNQPQVSNENKSVSEHWNQRFTEELAKSRPDDAQQSSRGTREDWMVRNGLLPEVELGTGQRAERQGEPRRYRRDYFDGPAAWSMPETQRSYGPDAVSENNTPVSPAELKEISENARIKQKELAEKLEQELVKAREREEAEKLNATIAAIPGMVRGAAERGAESAVIIKFAFSESYENRQPALDKSAQAVIDHLDKVGLKPTLERVKYVPSKDDDYALQMDNRQHYQWVIKANW